MTAHYDFYRNPSSVNSKKQPRLHARVVTHGTIGSDIIAKDIQACCSLTTADVKAVLTALQDTLVHHLKEGRRVHLEGLGFFQITLSCPPVRSSKEIRAESIRFKSVAFRPEQALRKRLHSTPFERVREKRHSRPLTEAEIDERLTLFFAEHTSLTRQRFQSLCGLTRTTALRRLKALIDSGKLQKSGYSRYPYYVPGEGFYGYGV